MVILTALWGLGNSALMVSTVVFGWYLLTRDKQVGQTGQALTLISSILLWVGLIGRAQRGHGWPIHSSADSAAGIALLMLLVYSIWVLVSSELESGFTVAATALILFSFGLGQTSSLLVTERLPTTAVWIDTLLKLGGGSLLALAAAISLTPLISRRQASHTAPAAAYTLHAQGEDFGPTAVRMNRGQQTRPDLQGVSETLVRGALFCLALSLAVDTWWLQKVGLGNENDAQPAGIALAWMIYFIALRLTAYPRWRGWPWAAILCIGFLCVLPILINAPWLEMTLPI